RRCARSWAQAYSMPAGREPNASHPARLRRAPQKQGVRVLRREVSIGRITTSQRAPAALPYASVTIEDEWLWGWDDTPGIVSVWAELDGHAIVWRRVLGSLVRQDVRFRPWLL